MNVHCACLEWDFLWSVTKREKEQYKLPHIVVYKLTDWSWWRRANLRGRPNQCFWDWGVCVCVCVCLGMCGCKYVWVFFFFCCCMCVCVDCFVCVCLQPCEFHTYWGACLCVSAWFCVCVWDCVIVCFPSFEERQCSTFHRGTESLPKQKLKPGGHGSACSVNRSS